MNANTHESKDAVPGPVAPPVGRPLREESWLSYGTRLMSPKHGACRIRFLYPRKLSAIVGNKPVGALADVWFRISEDGRILEWLSDTEVAVLD